MAENKPKLKLNLQDTSEKVSPVEKPRLTLNLSDDLTEPDKKKSGLGETVVTTDPLAKQSRLSYESPEYVSEYTSKTTPEGLTDQWYKEKGGITPMDKIQQFNTYVSTEGQNINEDKVKSKAFELGLIYNPETKKISISDNDINTYTEAIKRFSPGSEKPGLAKEILNKLDQGMKKTGQSLLELVASPATALGIAEEEVYSGRKAIELSRPESRYEGVTIQDQIKAGDVGGAVGQALSNTFEMLPNLIMSGSGTAGLITQATIAGEDKIVELKDKDIPEYAKTLNALASFTTSFLSEKLVTAPIMAKTSKLVSEVGEEKAKAVLNQSFKQSFSNYFTNLKGHVGDAALEAASEGAAQYADNAVTKALVNPDQDLNQGVVDAMATALVTTTAMKSPLIAAKGKEYIKDATKSIIGMMPSDLPMDMKIITSGLMLKKKVIEDNFKDKDPVFKDANKGEIDDLSNSIKVSVQSNTVRQKINILNKEMNKELNSNYPDINKLAKLETELNTINDNVRIEDVSLNKINRDIKNLTREYKRLYTEGVTGPELQAKSGRETEIREELTEAFNKKQTLLKKIYDPALGVSEDPITMAFNKESETEAINELNKQNLIPIDYESKSKEITSEKAEEQIESGDFKKDNGAQKEVLTKKEGDEPSLIEEETKQNEAIIEPKIQEISEKQIETPSQFQTPKTPPLLNTDIEVNKQQPDVQKQNVIMKNGLTFMNIDVAADKYKKYLKSNGFIPEGASEIRDVQSGAINSRLKQVNFTRKDFTKAAKEVYGSKKGMPNISKQQQQDLNNALANIGKTEESRNKAFLDNNIPEKMQPILLEMRSQVDALSNELSKQGLIQGDLELTIDENTGYYLTRAYKVFNDPDYTYDKVPPEIMNPVIKKIKSTFPEYTDAQVEGYIRKLMDRKDSPFNLAAEGRLSKQDLAILKKKKDIDPVIRALMGEYNDALFNYSNSMVKLANLVEKTKAEQAIVNDGLGKYLYEQPEGKYIKEVTLNKKTYYAEENVAEALSMTKNIDSLPPLLRAYYAMNAYTNIGKTILAPGTHFINYLSNYAIQIASGRNVLSPKTLKAHKAVFDNLFNTSNPKSREYIKKLAGLNLLDEGAMSRGFIEDMRNSYKNFEQFQSDDKKPSNLKKFYSGFEKTYAAEDAVHKVIAFEVEKSRYSKVLKNKYPELSPEELDAKSDKIAADIVKNTMPTWSKIPELVKIFRRTPFFGSFVSFNAEMIRTTKNLVKQIQSELKDPDTRIIGVKRMAGLISVLGFPAAASFFAGSRSGIDEEEKKDAMKFVAPFYKNSNLAFTEGKDGEYKFTDVTRLSAYGYFNKIANAFLNGEDMEEGVKDAATEAISAFVGPEIAAKAIYDIMVNENYKIYNPEESPEKQAKDIAIFLGRRTGPGIALTADKIYRSLNGDVSASGKKYELENELKSLFGLRTSTIDIGESFRYKLREYAPKLDNSRSIYTDVLRKDNVSAIDKQEAYEEAVSALDRNIKELHDYYSAAKRLGVKNSEIFKILDQAKVGNYKASKSIILGIKTGKKPNINRYTGKIL